jgi:hypothetical protein
VDTKKKIFLIAGILGVLVLLGAGVFAGFGLGKRSAGSGLEASLSRAESIVNDVTGKYTAVVDRLEGTAGLLATVGTKLTEYDQLLKQFRVDVSGEIDGLRRDVSAGLGYVNDSIIANNELYNEYLQRSERIQKGAGGVEAAAAGLENVLKRYQDAVSPGHD